MKAATSGVSMLLSATRSTRPLRSDGTIRQSKPAMAADAGLVPCAESGTNTTSRRLFKRAKCARITSSPASSPCAPAAGARQQTSMPVISHTMVCRRSYISHTPPSVSESCRGCAFSKPGKRASTSLRLGLYFMVQEPSGYGPLSTPCDSWLKRVKWRTTSTSLTSGKPIACLLRANSGLTGRDCIWEDAKTSLAAPGRCRSVII